jgi:hypothetical protein
MNTITWVLLNVLKSIFFMYSNFSSGMHGPRVVIQMDTISVMVGGAIYSTVKRFLLAARRILQ